MDRKILNVFIASPSDLSSEREILSDVVDRVNKIFGRRVDFQIELFGWEDTLPGYSRPQALINKDVEICDLFIGLMWERWGTESGEYSSGFEEEFQLARQRKLDGHALEIWLFFKQVGKERLTDPGDQLKKVIEFRKNIIDGRELLFKDFTSDSDFRDMIHDYLSAYLLDRAKEENTPPSDDSNLSSANPVNIVERNEGNTSIHIKNNELIHVYQSLLEQLRLGSQGALDFWQRLRSFVFSQALFSESHIGEVLGSHEANLVYRQRKHWTLSRSEELLLIRSFLHDSLGHIPGWYWIKTNSDHLSLLPDLAIDDQNIMVRKGAIKVLSSLSYRPTTEFIKALLESGEPELTAPTLELAKRCHTSDIAPWLERLASSIHEKFSSEALGIYVDLLYLHNPEKSFDVLVERASEPSSLYLEKLKSMELGLDTALIKNKGLNANPQVRLYCAQYLDAVNAIDEELAEKLLGDTYSKIRLIGFKWLVNNGKKIDLSEVDKYFPEPDEKRNTFGQEKEVNQNEVKLFLLRAMAPEDLERLVDFYSWDGVLAYRVLASEFTASYADRLRQDLEEDFETFLESSKARLRSKYGKLAENIIDQNTKFDSYVKSTFIGAVLKGILSISVPDDVRFAHKYIEDLLLYGDIVIPAITLLTRYGEDGDVETLLATANRLYGETKMLAIRGAVQISASKSETIQRLVESDDEAIAEVAVQCAEQLGQDERLELYEKCTYSEQASVRIAATRSLIQLCERTQIEEYIDQYIEQGRYFYDVVTILDEHLYR